MSVTAEGVETHEQFEESENAGVNFAQGYLLGRPMPLGDSKVSLNQIMRTWVQRCAASRGMDDPWPQFLERWKSCPRIIRARAASSAALAG